MKLETLSSLVEKHLLKHNSLVNHSNIEECTSKILALRMMKKHIFQQ